MKLPRDVSGNDLVAALRVFDYQVAHQTGSHIQLMTTRDGVHHVTVPQHRVLRVGTLRSILRQLMDHHNLDRDELLELLQL